MLTMHPVHRNHSNATSVTLDVGCVRVSSVENLKYLFFVGLGCDCDVTVALIYWII